jgi:uncharacterized protein (TIGR02271 family)
LAAAWPGPGTKQHPASRRGTPGPQGSISRGEVRLRKEVVTETQTVQVPVTREELVIERRPVDQATPATGSIGESEIRIPLSEERASVDTSTVVREEVAVGKKPIQEVRDLTGKVRREELVVEDPTKRTA